MKSINGNIPSRVKDVQLKGIVITVLFKTPTYQFLGNLIIYHLMLLIYKNLLLPTTPSA